ncbi:MAG: galactokinase [Deinococcales bacterium]
MSRPSPAAVEAVFRDRFGEAPTAVVRAPGRVNLIGEHTDYNDGFVLPMAIDREIRIALRPRTDDTVRVFAADVGREASFTLSALGRGDGWQEYVKGVAWALRSEGYEVTGWDGVMAGDVPRGAGLSSSAALELAAARAFQASSGFLWDATRMARLCQRAENRWVGVNSGIMDQLISALGREGHALLLDCRTLEGEAVPLPDGHVVVVLDTGTRRGLVGSAYNERRAQCEAAARHFGVPALRDVSQEVFEAGAGGLPELPRRRARHVVGENARTLAAAEAMRRGDAAALGRLMNASHASLKEDFEVSSEALDAIVACAHARPECRGARMTGAGFGGCAVALVEEGAVNAFVAAVAACYDDGERQASAYVCRPADGASRLR